MSGTFKMRLIDSHIHLHSSVYQGKFDLVFKRAIDADLEEIWLVAIDEESACTNIEIISEYQKKYPSIKLKLGIGFDMELLVPGSSIFDPEMLKIEVDEIGDWVVNKLNEIKNYAETKNLKVNLIGEIGMDNYWLSQNGEISADLKQKSLNLQREMLKAQLNYAAKLKLPVSLHSRGAEQECIDFIRAYKQKSPELDVVFHSFTGTKEQMKQILEMGCRIGVNGIVTYKSASELVDAVTSLLDLYPSQFLLETDAPYLIPANSDRKELENTYGEAINEPARVADVVKILKVKNF